MKFNKKATYHQKEYSVSVDTREGVSITVDDISCENIVFIKEAKVYCAYLPSDNSLIVIISNNKPYILEAPQEGDITEYVKQKVFARMGLFGKTVVAVAWSFPFFSISYSLLKFDENFVWLLLLEAIMLVTVRCLNVLQRTPTVKVSTKNIIFYIVSILVAIALYVAMVAIIA